MATLISVHAFIGKRMAVVESVSFALASFGALFSKSFRKFFTQVLATGILIS